MPLSKFSCAYMDRLKNFLQERYETSSLLDITKGAFWQTPLGREVADFTRSVTSLMDTSQRYSTSQTAQILQLKDRGLSSYQVSNLLVTGIVTKLDRQGNRYAIRPQQLLLVGIIFLYLESGHTLKETEDSLKQILHGSNLKEFLGSTNKSFKGNTSIYDENSPWKEFPIGQHKVAGRHQAPKYDSKIEEAPFIPEKDMEVFNNMNRKEVIQLIEKLPNSFEEFNSFQTGLPPSTDIVAMSVYRVNEAFLNKHPYRKYDRNDEATFREIRWGFTLMSQLMEKHPSLDTVGKVYRAVQRKLEAAYLRKDS